MVWRAQEEAEAQEASRGLTAHDSVSDDEYEVGDGEGEGEESMELDEAW